jgi:hypothetical protein
MPVSHHLEICGAADSRLEALHRLSGMAVLFDPDPHAASFYFVALTRDADSCVFAAAFPERSRAASSRFDVKGGAQSLLVLITDP